MNSVIAFIKDADNKFTVAYSGALILTAITFIVGLSAGMIPSINWVEVFAVATSYVCVILVNYQSRWNYPWGIISQIAIFFTLIFSGLPALAIFNLYLVGSLIYGFYYWKSDENTVPVTYVASWKNWLGYALFGALVLALYFGCVYIIEPSNFANVSKVDAFIAALSGIAQFLLDRKKLESWYLWIAVNIISIPYYFYIGLTFFAFQYIFFLINAVIALIAWRKSMGTSNNDDIYSNVSGDWSGSVRSGI
ncbi:nicotinamide mononucleotide transporter PnuC [Sinorhizobium phage phiM7]|uniref:Nicotinamide mononucleotide transporter PnuC n=3 Tax=Emdodecavirus TaxID=1980937 RepID=S5MDI3_9CAUD|nr:PnuC-like nicotinamide mononucleotide transport [Sinorhizobium phage phiM12]YP_009212562.1 PnuC-like nicotinamide mononucleotide transport [Sinorhizobium phage phiN3]YP_009601442.1 PnuC-like nicotinamide mononucleotide transport [Sinorhizobium phage phiM7]AKF13222.1 nicotinamide mononucleotide transporter PnuC [Sinorhizobium phage phiM19]AGR48039.1 nicotinamide mononucleotide transporter PnuC [Sinorhizobium phage phiM12]AKF12863.1 nicotinamide mononucleotide transporter PnuC [Sinorhizobium 